MPKLNATQREGVHQSITEMIPLIEERYAGDDFKVSRTLKRKLHKHVPKLMEDLGVQGLMVLNIILTQFVMASIERDLEERGIRVEEAQPKPAPAGEPAIVLPPGVER